MKLSKKKTCLFQCFSIECRSVKHLSIQRVIHFSDVCFRNVVWTFLDRPFGSKRSQWNISQISFVIVLLYIRDTDKSKQQLKGRIVMCGQKNVTSVLPAVPFWVVGLLPGPFLSLRCRANSFWCPRAISLREELENIQIYKTRNG